PLTTHRLSLPDALPILGSITIRELATHTSGLPRMPTNLDSEDGDLAPYKDYTVEKLMEYLKTAVLGEKTYLYSNTAVALLTQIIDRKSTRLNSSHVKIS